MHKFAIFLRATLCILVAILPCLTTAPGLPSLGENGRTSARDSKTYFDYVSTEELKELFAPEFRRKLQIKMDQVPLERPPEIPQCLYEGFLYDLSAHKCAEPGTRAHCEASMVFLPIPDSPGMGSCACEQALKSDCWGRPQILADGQCYDVASQGYCKPGETLVPTSLKTAKCGEDACLAFVPPEDLIFSPESQEFPELYPVFNFTFQGECFFTETQAFCAPGNIARFILPYKIPVCVPPFTKRCGSWEDTGFGTIGTLPVICKTGSAANFERSLCVPLPLVIF